MCCEAGEQASRTMICDKLHRRWRQTALNRPVRPPRRGNPFAAGEQNGPYRVRSRASRCLGATVRNLRPIRIEIQTSRPFWQTAPCRRALRHASGLTVLVLSAGLIASASPVPAAAVMRLGHLPVHERGPVAVGVHPLAFPHFTGQEFNELFSTAALPNLFADSETAPITESVEMDDRIRARAEDRGYLRRPLPADDALMRRVHGGLMLQLPAAAAWLALQQDAAANGFGLELDSAYRGHRYQREVFLRPMKAPYELDAFAERMKVSAPPGYSKHHTGYAIDVSQPGYWDFDRAPVYEWLSADNFANAKRHGWIPSYPPDGGRQGPVPEPWEFTYVGVEAILCFHQPADDSDLLCNA